MSYSFNDFYRARKNKLLYFIRYTLKCFLFFPITFIRRVLFGKETLHKRFFWDKWGFISPEIIRRACNKKNILLVTNSGGELIQAIPFLKRMKIGYPEINIFVATESYDTYQYAKGIPAIDEVFFPPWDISFVCRRVLKDVRPLIIIFIEHCYFPMLCKEAKSLGIKIILCSGLITPKLLKGYFLMQRSYALGFYNYIDNFYLKSNEDLNNLRNLKVNDAKIAVLGDMKFDLEHILLKNGEKERLLKEFKILDTDKVFMVGSLHKSEVDLILEAFRFVRKDYPNSKLIIAPRWDYDIPFIEERLKKFTFSFVFRTKIASSSTDNYDVIIVDTFGELPRLYGIASVVFIANTIYPINIRRLGHNVFEPLAHNVPLVFGPHLTLWENFTTPLKEVWPGCEVKDSKTLANSVIEILQNKELNDMLKKTAHNLTRGYGNIIDNYLKQVEVYINAKN